MKRLNNQEIWEVLLNGDQWAIDEVLKRRIRLICWRFWKSMRMRLDRF